MVYVTLAMILLLAFGAGVADIGMLYENRRQLQNGADAAAMAGAEELLDLFNPDRQTLAVNAALDYAQRNGISPDQMLPGYPRVACEPLPYNGDCDTSSPYYYNSVEVAADRNLGLMVSTLLGSGVGNVAAEAAALVGPMLPTEGLWPVAVSYCDDWDGDGDVDCTGPPERVPIRLKLASPPGSSGNFHPLDWPPSGGGAADYEDDFKYSYGNEPGDYVKSSLPWCGDSGYPSPPGYPDCTWVDDPHVETETGNKAGPTWDSIEYLVSMASGDSDPSDGVVYVPGSQDDVTSPWNTSGPGRCTWAGAPYQPADLPLYGGGSIPPDINWVGDASTCHRVGIVPFIAQEWDDLGGNKPVNIIGWGAFYLIGLGHRDTGVWTRGGMARVWGYFTNTAIVSGGRFSEQETGLWGMRLWR